MSGTRDIAGRRYALAVLEIARQVRPSLYDVHFEKPPPLVPRNHCFEVDERLDAKGNILQPLDEAGVRQVAVRLREEAVESVAVCLLHSYLKLLLLQPYTQ